MEISELEVLYNKQLENRDLITFIKEEIEVLEKNEIVKKYSELLQIYNEIKELDGKNDLEILKDIVDNNKININLPNCYYCYGKDYDGYLNENGEYSLLPNDIKLPKIKKPIKVALYKNFEDPSIVKIIPLKDVSEFEKENPIVRSHENDPEEDYKIWRFKVIREELMGYKYHKQKKKVNNE